MFADFVVFQMQIDLLIHLNIIEHFLLFLDGRIISLLHIRLQLLFTNLSKLEKVSSAKFNLWLTQHCPIEIGMCLWYSPVLLHIIVKDTCLFSVKSMDIAGSVAQL